MPVFVFGLIGYVCRFWRFFLLDSRYADLKVKMAMMEAEKDGEADLQDEWQ